MDYSSVKWQENGKLKLLIIVGTRPEIIRLAAVINKTRKYFDVILAHTGQNYDYNLNGIFFRDLKLKDPEVYMNAVGSDLGETMGNIIAESYKLMVQIKPEAVLVLGDTNSCLSVIGAKRLHIPTFHMEAGTRCKDECLPEETNRRIVDIISDVNMAYSEHARRYLADTGLPKERTYVTGSPMAEVLRNNLDDIMASDIHDRLKLEKGKYILLSAHREENIDTDKNFYSLFNAINKMAEKYDMPILYSCHPRSRKKLESSGFKLDNSTLFAKFAKHNIKTNKQQHNSIWEISFLQATVLLVNCILATILAHCSVEYSSRTKATTTRCSFSWPMYKLLPTTPIILRKFDRTLSKWHLTIWQQVLTLKNVQYSSKARYRNFPNSLHT